MRIIYESKDGTMFDDKEECKTYEKVFLEVYSTYREEYSRISDLEYEHFKKIIIFLIRNKKALNILSSN